MSSYGLMLVRDEADILPESIPHYLTWLDGLYVMDLGSTDETWQVLRDLASRHPRLVLHSTRDLIFQEGLRAILFDAYRDRFRDGDWIVKADADEFYDLPPAEFAAKYLRPHETCIYVQWYYFRLTSIDVAPIARGEVSMADERSRPIAARRRYYKLPTHAEPRAFRYRRSMRWPATNAFPYNMGYVARARIPVRHYPHRDPWQMAARYRLRAAMMTTDLTAVPQWRLADWRRDVVLVDPATGVAHEQNAGGAGLSSVDAHTDSELRYWRNGESLPESGFAGTHLAPPVVRLVQRVIHAGAVRTLDRLRPAYERSWEPAAVPGPIRQRLAAPPPDPFAPSQLTVP